MLNYLFFPSHFLRNMLNICKNVCFALSCQAQTPSQSNQLILCSGCAGFIHHHILHENEQMAPKQTRSLFRCVQHFHVCFASFLSLFFPPAWLPSPLELRRKAFDVTGCYYLTQLCRAPWAPRNRQMLCFPLWRANEVVGETSNRGDKWRRRLRVKTGGSGWSLFSHPFHGAKIKLRWISESKFSHRATIEPLSPWGVLVNISLYDIDTIFL